MKNEDRVRVKEILVWYKQKKALRLKRVDIAIWLESTLIDLRIRKARIVFEYYINRMCNGNL